MIPRLIDDVSRETSSYLLVFVFTSRKPAALFSGRAGAA
jgi:hypothetical protein